MPRKLATVVIAAKAGRLGNRLFLSAYFMANARALGYRLMNPAFGEYASLFEGIAMDPLCRFPEEGRRENPEFATQCREVLLGLASGIGSLATTLGLPESRQLDIRKSHDAKDQNYDLCGVAFDEALHSNRLLIVKGWKFRDDSNLVRFHSEISRYFTPVASLPQPWRRPIKRVITSSVSTSGRVITGAGKKEYIILKPSNTPTG